MSFNTATICINRAAKTMQVYYSIADRFSSDYPLTRKGLADLISEVEADAFCWPNADISVTWDDLSCHDEITLDLGEIEWDEY